MPDPTWNRVSPLTLQIEAVGRDVLQGPPQAGGRRLTTRLRLEGAGRIGEGEDVNYDAEEQETFVRYDPLPDLKGSWTLEEFSRRLDEVDLFRDAPRHPASRAYRRWALESAALDLALSQAGTHLGGLLGREVRPVRFVVSLRLEDQEDEARVRSLRRHHPALGLKLDPTSSWTAETFAFVRGLEQVAVLDLKGRYEGTPVDQPADPALYRRVVEEFPNALIEDPKLTAETRPVLEPVRERVTWDAPIHGVDDIEALEWKPRTLNMKPSRFGSLKALLDAYDHCRREGIALYGGGQAEVGIGRLQVQTLAALFHPDAPNDVAPRGFNDPAADLELLPGSPLELPTVGTGFPARR